MIFKKNEPLAPYTTFKIGGPARYFVEVANTADLKLALEFAVSKKISYFILGAGSNILVADQGFDGLVIRLIQGEETIKENLVTAFAGNYWPRLVLNVINAGLSGLEFSANIPGTVGGGVRGNAGAYGKGIGDFVKEVEVLVVTENLIEKKVFTQADCEFAYRESVFKKHPEYIISSVTFELEKTKQNAEEILIAIKNENADRCAKQPLSFPSAGCSFKNIIYTEALAQYNDWQKNGKIPAGKFIDECGLKGTKIGGAMISDVHANFIVNFNQATASDVAQLISLVKTKVRDTFGVQLEEEIGYVGV